MDLISYLVKEGWLKTPCIIEAFKKIKRTDFIPNEMKGLSEINEPLPIGYGQTISQPLTVAFMLEQLQPEPGNKILDIGSGSGWTSALLAQIVKNGKVIALEILPELKEFGEKNVAKYNFVKKGIVKFFCLDATNGYINEAPYDRILVSAEVQKEIPLAWKEQLKINGRIVVPINNSVWTLIKKTDKDFKVIKYSGFSFVPLIHKDNIKDK